jgi:uncharacterized protein YegL
MNLRRVKISTLSAALALVATAACSSTPRSFDDTQPSEPGLTNGVPEAGTKDTGVACLSEQVKAEAVPLAMLVLVDRSGSMLGEKWDAATTAIRSFADRSEVVGMKMGVQFFPPLAAGDQCSSALYKSLAVPIASLPDNVIPIQQKLLSTNADGGGTPMGGGLDGSIAAMRDFLTANPLHEGVVILVTDGDPTSCGSVSAVAGIAAGGAKPASGMRTVRTFAVGMAGATFGNLNQIAAAGGGFPTAFDVGAGATAQQGLVDALEKVRTGALGCEYTLPLPSADKGVLDLDSVVFEFTAGKNDPKVTMRRVADKAACGATTGGYYYDDPKTPTRVVLCPASCDTVRGGTADATIELGFGCIQRPN